MICSYLLFARKTKGRFSLLRKALLSSIWFRVTSFNIWLSKKKVCALTHNRRIYGVLAKINRLVADKLPHHTKIVPLKGVH